MISTKITISQVGRKNHSLDKSKMIFFILPGIICAEGELWKDQRKFVMGCLRNFGAVKNSPKKDKFQELIKDGVNEFLQVK